jgi:hypothetical protein
MTGVDRGEPMSEGQTAATPATTVFISERNLHGLTPERFAKLQHALLDASCRLRAAGESIQLLRSTYVPSEGRLLCIFSAASRELVYKAIELAQLPLPKVAEALDYTASGDRLG